jgi:hypothetical protein
LLAIHQRTDNQNIQGTQKLNSPQINEPIKTWATELKRTFSKEESKWPKKCSPSLAIKEMQIKTTIRFHLTPVRIIIIKNTTKKQMLVRMLGKRNPRTLLVQPLWKTIWRVLTNLNIDLPYDPAIPLLGIYPREGDTGYSRGTCTPMFIAVLFIIAKLWKQPRCPTASKWIKKTYLYTMEFYSAMKKNEILSFAGKWLELENIILSKVGQVQKAQNRMFSLKCGLWI